jgi:hypothetical protein
VCRYTRASGPVMCVRTLASRQLAVPAQNRVRSHNGRHLVQRGASELVSEHGETSPFVITQAQASSAQVRPQHPVLFLQEHDHVGLLSVNPAAQRRNEPREGTHGRILRHPARSSFGTVRPHGEREEQRATRYRRWEVPSYQDPSTARSRSTAAASPLTRPSRSPQQPRAHLMFTLVCGATAPASETAATPVPRAAAMYPAAPSGNQVLLGSSKPAKCSFPEARQEYGSADNQ